MPGPRRLFNFIGTVYDSLNDRGRQVIVELTLAGTLTTPPEIFTVLLLEAHATA